MKKSAKIPATVITGFLGAGKTTLVRHLVENANGRRLALIINEFGDLGIDRGLLDGCGIAGCREEDIIELANGCLCCTVADDFLPTIAKLIDRPNPPDHILIETSGLALPKPLVKAFNWPEIRSRVTVDGVVAVIDAAAVAVGRFASSEEERARPDHDNPLEEVFEDQLLCADLVLLNKTDLLSEDSRQAVVDSIAAKLRPGVKVLETRHAVVEVPVLLGLGSAAEDDLDGRPSHHDAEGLAHDHDDFESFTLALGGIQDIDALVERLVGAVKAHDILRIKGFLDIPGKPLRHVVQGVGPRFQRYFDRPWRAGEDRASKLVVIGLKGLDRTAIAGLLQPWALVG